MRYYRYVLFILVALIGVVSACSTATENSSDKEPEKSIVQYRINLPEGISGLVSYHDGDGGTTAQPVRGKWLSTEYTVLHGIEMTIDLKVIDMEAATIEMYILVDKIEKKKMIYKHDLEDNFDLELSLSIVVGEDS